jgi:flagellar hook assembly protein FlgD
LSDIVISIYNILGQEVTRVADGHFDAGVHSVEWNAGDKASGVYLYRIKAGDFVKTRKMLLLK